MGTRIRSTGHSRIPMRSPNNSTNSTRAIISKCPSSSARICKYICKIQIHLSVFRYNWIFPFSRNYTPFEATQPTSDTSSYYDPNAQYSGGMFTPTDAGKYYSDGGEGSEFDNEPPLLEGQYFISRIRIHFITFILKSAFQSRFIQTNSYILIEQILSRLFQSSESIPVILCKK